MSDTLMEFIYQLVGRGDLVHAKCLREKCYEKIRQRDRELMALATPQPITHNISTKTATILSFKSEHLAEQMTLLDSQLFHKIEVTFKFDFDFFQQFNCLYFVSTRFPNC